MKYTEKNVRRFPQTNAQIAALVVVALGIIVVLIAFQKFSSLSGFLKAVPVSPDGACYISSPIGEGESETSCLQTTTAKACQEEANGKPYLFVPGGICPRPFAATANMCEQAGVELLLDGLGKAAASTGKEARESAMISCQDDLLGQSKLVCPKGCSRYVRDFVPGTCTVEQNQPNNFFSASCSCKGVVGCSSDPTSPGTDAGSQASPLPLPSDAQPLPKPF